MKNGKKVLAVFLSLILAASSAAAISAVAADEGTETAAASESSTASDYSYSEFSDGTVQITKYTGSDSELTIPSEIDGKKVTSIGGEAFEFCDSLTSVTIPDSVTSIGYNAFCGCTNLSKITIPDSVIDVGSAAFADTAWYDNQSNGLVYVGKVAYTYKNLNDMPKNTELVLKEGTKAIAGYAFATEDMFGDRSDNKYSLIGITIPDSVTYIGVGAFMGCKGLTSVNIPNGVECIYEWTFNNCTNLKSVTIPESVTSIGMYAFAGCDSLTNVVIPSGVTDINEGAFAACNNLTISGCAGTAAETYAKENNIKFVAISEKEQTTLIDEITKISVKVDNGVIANGVSLSVSEFKPESDDLLFSYDISLKDSDGNEVEPNGNITVSIPCDAEGCTVYRVEADGTKTDMNASYTDGCYVFTTDHFSVYNLVKSADEPSTDNTTNTSSSNGTASSTNDTTSTGKDGKAVNTGDNGTAAAIAAVFAGAALTAIILRKKHEA